MSEVLSEVREAISRLSLNGDVKRLPEHEEADLYYELLGHFVSGEDRRWWWESFKQESRSCTYSDGKGFKRLVQFVPDVDEKVWFMIDDDELPTYPVFEATPTEIMRIVGKCFAFEYYLIPKSKAWLICENHHGRVIGVGTEVTEKMSAPAV